MDKILADMIKLPSEIMTDIAIRVRKNRTIKGLSQMKLAEQSGVSLGSIKRFESTGKISLESILKLALVLDSLVEFESLFTIDDTPKTLDDLFKV